jgi:hypothetical protein
MELIPKPLVHMPSDPFGLPNLSYKHGLGEMEVFERLEIDRFADNAAQRFEIIGFTPAIGEIEFVIHEGVEVCGRVLSYSYNLGTNFMIQGYMPQVFFGCGVVDARPVVANHRKGGPYLLNKPDRGR